MLGSSIYRVTLTGIEDDHFNRSDPYEWVFITGDYEYDPDCSPIMISNNNFNQNAISQSNYYATEITSDGVVGNMTEIGFKAEEFVMLEPGFEVESGGQLFAEIEDCEE